MSLEAVVFDLDDTLFSERSYVLSGFRVVAAWLEREHGVDEERAFAGLQELFERGVRLNTFDVWLAGRGLTEEVAITDLVEVYRAHAPTIAPASGVPELLERLGGRTKLGLVSDGYASVQRKKFEALGLAAHFDAVVFSDDLGREFWKPSPRPFEVVAEALGVDPSECVYVSDNPLKDFIGARLVGMATVRLRRSDGVYAQIDPPSEAHAPDVELPDIASVGGLLENNWDADLIRQLGETNYTPRTIAGVDRPTNVRTETPEFRRAAGWAGPDRRSGGDVRSGANGDLEWKV
jgi:putative hydrolase of the HAD superfamily